MYDYAYKWHGAENRNVEKIRLQRKLHVLQKMKISKIADNIRFQVFYGCLNKT